MPRFVSLAKGAAALAFASAVFTTVPALADDSYFEGVMNMDVWASNPGPQVVVRNIAGNHHIDSLNLAVQGNSVAVGVSGLVDCTGIQFENFAQRFGHFLSSGAFGIGRTSLLLSEAIPNSNDIDRDSALGHHGFQVPVALLANPQIGIDPAAIVLAAAEQSPDKLAWLRQDHTLTVKIPLRWESDCAFYTRNKITKKTIVEAATTSYLTKDVDLKIKYQGDPQLFALNPQIGQSQQPGGLQAGPQPFEITSAQFQPNMPHHVGACPATKQIRVNYQGQGQGELRVRIAAGNMPMHESGVISFDSKNGAQHYDFELETPKAYVNNINNTVQHNLRVYVRSKAVGENTWSSDYQLMDQAVWRTRCTPVVNPVVGGGAGGKAPGYQAGGNAKPARAPLKVLPAAEPPARPARQPIQ